MYCAILLYAGPAGYGQGGYSDLSPVGTHGGMSGGVPGIVARQGGAVAGGGVDEPTCKEPGCYSFPNICGYCQECYDRKIRQSAGGASGYSPRDLVPPAEDKKICKTPGCAHYPMKNGYCYDCYYNIQKTTEGGGDYATEGNRCKEPSCRRRPIPQRLGYCEQCYEARYLVGGDF